MILVRHIMTEAPKTLSPDRTIADAAGLMEQYDVGVIPLADEDGKLVGLVTDRDLVLRIIAKQQDPREMKLGDVATRNVITTTPDTNVSDARDLMAENKIRRLPVVKEGKLVGIVALGDIAVADASKRAVGEALHDVSESPSTTDAPQSGPARGTPERVRRNDARGAPAGVLKQGYSADAALSSFERSSRTPDRSAGPRVSRIVRRVCARMRLTCICETPTSRAISD